LPSGRDDDSKSGCTLRGNLMIISPENLPGKWLAVSPISHYKKALVVFSGLC